jgi:hypothetical protein
VDIAKRVLEKLDATESMTLKAKQDALAENLPSEQNAKEGINISRYCRTQLMESVAGRLI